MRGLVTVDFLCGVESGEKEMKINAQKGKEKMIQESGTALNHCNRSCGKRYFRSIRWEDCVLWPWRGWMFDGKLRGSKACSWVWHSERLMIYDFSYVLHLSTERSYFVIGVTSTNSLLSIKEVYYLMKPVQQQPHILLICTADCDMFMKRENLCLKSFNFLTK